MKSATRGLRVEFLGLPGVGKSTLCHHVAERLRRAGVPVSEPIEALSQGTGRGRSPILKRLLKVFHAGRELMLHPQSSIRLLAAVASTRQPSPLVLARLSFSWLVLASLIRRPDTVHALGLFDQGVFQGLWSTAVEARRPALDRMARALIDSLPLPDVVAVIEADPRVVRGRLAARHGHESRADRWSANGRDETVGSAATLESVEGLLEALRGSATQQARGAHGRVACGPGLHIIRVANPVDGDVEAVADRLATEIRDLMAEVPRVPGRGPRGEEMDIPLSPARPIRPDRKWSPLSLG